MGIKIRVKNAASEMKRIQSQFEDILSSNLGKQTKLLTDDLKSETPVDTGKARDSWSYRQISKNTFEIINSTNYIGKLNRGSSKQAPAFFIEITALKYGKPRGLIVNEVSET